MLRFHLTPLFLILGGLIMSANESAAQSSITKLSTVEGITEYQLSNGLKLLLFPDQSKPIVTINMTVFVGSRHEGYGETGMAHLLEHMLFKGTPTFPNVPVALKDHGAGNFNGTTWLDRTNYYETMPATDENLEFGIHLEADRLINSFVKREDLISEMTVVRNEFEMGENDPERIMSQRMMATAFEWHNYGKSTIGNRTDIERVPIDNLQAFYRKYYRVDNTMLVVAGKFDEKKALALVEKHFGALKKPTNPMPNTYTEEPAQDGERIVALRRVGTVGAVGAVYHIPAGASPDYPALEILEDVLTTEPGGRIYKALVESKKASSISSSIYALHDPGIIEVTAKVEGGDVEAAKAALLESLETVSKTPVTAEEVARSKSKFLKIQENLVANTERLAVQLSEWAACGDWRLFFLHRDRIEKVTAEEVNRVAAKYLVRNNRTVGIYYPEKKSERAEIPTAPKVAELVKDYKGRAVVSAGEAFEPTPENIEKRVQRGTLGNLKTAFLAKKTRGEFLNLVLNLRYGNPESLKGYPTAASLLPTMMRRGTTKHTRQQLTDELDKLGAQVAISGQLGLLNVSVQVKKANLVATLKLVGEILREPSFPAEEFEVLKREIREQLNEAKADPQGLAFKALTRKLNPYPPTDLRYEPTYEEALERLDAATVDQLKKLHGEQLSAQAGELAAVGDFEASALIDTLGPILQDWKTKVAYARVEKPANPNIQGERIVINTPDKANATYLAGIVKQMTDKDADFAALQVGNFLFGAAPLASRLSQRVRGEEGLSYGTGSMYTAEPIDPSSRLFIYAITNPDNMGKVEKVIGEEVEKLLRDGTSLQEVNEAKKAYLEQLKVSRTRDAGLAAQLANGLFIDRTFDFYADLEKKIQALEPKDVDAAFKKFLDPKKLIIVEAGEFEKGKKK
jgi:zinc protease